MAEIQESLHDPCGLLLFQSAHEDERVLVGRRQPGLQEVVVQLLAVLDAVRHGALAAVQGLARAQHTEL